MLEELFLEDYVLFANTSLTFEAGLNVISGETGAGKSLVAGAVGLALGQRATAGQIRTGVNIARISSVFRYSAKTLAAVLDAHDISPPDDGQLIFQRTLKREGASRLSVCGAPISLQAARSVGEHLIDFAAQNEQTRLTDPVYQRELLDRFGGIEKAAVTFTTSFRNAQAILARLNASDSEREQNRRRLANIRTDLDALDALAYAPASDGDIEERITAVSNAEAVRTIADRAIDELYEDDESIHDQLGALIRETKTFRETSEGLRRATGGLTELTAQIADTVQAYRDAIDAVDCEPGALEKMIARAEAIKEISRRLECTPDTLAETEAALRTEETTLANWETDGAAVRDLLDAALADVAQRGLALRKKRGRAAKSLDRAVAGELEELGMAAAGFVTHIEPLWQKGNDPLLLLTRASSRGLEDISFRLAPNPGEDAALLSTNASGGEASRTMLAIKAALAGVHCPPVLFFDEIDAGVGGRLGDVIARKLAALATTRQVIVITHLPQIAARAARHWRITKQIRDKRTIAQAELLTADTRIDEVAAMIHGDKRTETTRAQAREMIAEAQLSESS